MIIQKAAHSESGSRRGVELDVREIGPGAPVTAHAGISVDVELTAVGGLVLVCSAVGIELLGGGGGIRVRVRVRVRARARVRVCL